MIPQSIKNKIEIHLRTKISNVVHVGGGCISESVIVGTAEGRKYFLKFNKNVPPDMFSKESNGLIEISKSKAIRVPKVELTGEDFILIEFIDGKEKGKNFFAEFGYAFAKMHKYTSNEYGFFEDNYIGSTFQKNITNEIGKTNWTHFYYNNRLLYQFQLAEKNGYVDQSFRAAFKKLEDKLENILQTSTEEPSLLHGDLWSGNFITDENGRACLIDPAVYYGHREADLAMTKLFGGFTKEFYLSYDETFPLNGGYEYRENIYKLYHVLNHLNLFGKSYYQQALSLIKFYL
ncbi:MAG: fructosamine kinase family protein [Ignavibacteriaceae bacterium]|nr:fructosamine kinase family protein [Ignavibacteriaceae bacterium]